MLITATGILIPLNNPVRPSASIRTIIHTLILRFPIPLTTPLIVLP